jgi:MmyB-like transcription regulator ligand binding domain
MWSRCSNCRAATSRTGDVGNLTRFLFLDAAASDFYVDWKKTANDAVAILRTEAGRNPYDRNLSDLVGELSTRSKAFRSRWAAHDVDCTARASATTIPWSATWSWPMRRSSCRRTPV